MSNTTALTPTGIAILDRPVTASEKSAYVREMFDDVAPRYDLLNTALSAGVHHLWRAFAARCAALEPGESALDVCTGTGAWAAALKRAVGAQGQVVGVDFSLPMLRHGTRAFAQADSPRAQADAARLPFADDSFDAATVAFGIRNVAEVERAFAEMVRVVRPGGRVVCLEFAEPRPGLFRALYDLHARYVMPNVGGAISGRRDAYAYLPASVALWKTRRELSAILRGAGLDDVRWVDLTFGMVCVHVGIKPLE